jgi:hypothetical protein
MSKTAAKELTDIEFTTPSTTSVPAVVEPVAATVPAVAPTQDATILTIIERAARDPNVDIDKMERLIAMHERVQSKSAQVEYDNAMSDAQEAMKPIRANLENPQTRSEYADYSALDKVVRPIYARHGFSLSFSTAEGAPENCVRIVCTVAHRSGHRERPTLDMPADGKGAKGNDVMTKTHATGAAITYGKRYLLGMIFNLAVTRDDDGNGAGADDDIESLAPKNAPRDAEGKLLSTYSAERAKQAQQWADEAIQYLNMINARDAQEWRREKQTVEKGKRKSALQWLADNSPGQYVRVQQCYQNVTGEYLE